jgi:isopropylmalate/homocitrate/citramalate synthase
MSVLEKDKYWMNFQPYRAKVVGQEEKLIFGPTTLHGDAIKMKCKQMKIVNYDERLDEILQKAHDSITEKKFITEKELEELIRTIID